MAGSPRLQPRIVNAQPIVTGGGGNEVASGLAALASAGLNLYGTMKQQELLDEKARKAALKEQQDAAVKAAVSQAAVQLQEIQMAGLQQGKDTDWIATQQNLVLLKLSKSNSAAAEELIKLGNTYQSSALTKEMMEDTEAAEDHARTMLEARQTAMTEQGLTPGVEGDEKKYDLRVAQDTYLKDLNRSNSIREAEGKRDYPALKDEAYLQGALMAQNVISGLQSPDRAAQNKVVLPSDYSLVKEMPTEDRMSLLKDIQAEKSRAVASLTADLSKRGVDEKDQTAIIKMTSTEFDIAINAVDPKGDADFAQSQKKLTEALAYIYPRDTVQKAVVLDQYEKVIASPNVKALTDFINAVTSIPGFEATSGSQVMDKLYFGNALSSLASQPNGESITVMNKPAKRQVIDATVNYMQNSWEDWKDYTAEQRKDVLEVAEPLWYGTLGSIESAMESHYAESIAVPVEWSASPDGLQMLNSPGFARMKSRMVNISGHFGTRMADLVGDGLSNEQGEVPFELAIDKQGNISIKGDVPSPVLGAVQKGLVKMESSARALHKLTGESYEDILQSFLDKSEAVYKANTIREEQGARDNANASPEASQEVTEADVGNVLESVDPEKMAKLQIKAARMDLKARGLDPDVLSDEEILAELA